MDHLLQRLNGVDAPVWHFEKQTSKVKLVVKSSNQIHF